MHKVINASHTYIHCLLFHDGLYKSSIKTHVIKPQEMPCSYVWNVTYDMCNVLYDQVWQNQFYHYVNFVLIFRLSNLMTLSEHSILTQTPSCMQKILRNSIKLTEFV